MSLIPIRCYTCGGVICIFWNSYQEKITQGQSSTQALDELRVSRPCCRIMLISHVDLSDTMIKQHAMAKDYQKKMEKLADDTRHLAIFTEKE